MSKEPMTEERLAEIRGREKAATQGPWKAGKDDFTKNIIQAAKDRGTIIVQRRDDHNMFWNSYIPIEQTFADADFIAHAREDIPALLDEVERLRAENEVLEKALEDLGFFVRTKLDYCPADFIGEGIDEDTDFSCHTEYDPDDASQKCYGDCWADAFRNQAENDIKKFEEWKLRQDMEV